VLRLTLDKGLVHVSSVSYFCSTILLPNVPSFKSLLPCWSPAAVTYSDTKGAVFMSSNLSTIPGLLSIILTSYVSIICFTSFNKSTYFLSKIFCRLATYICPSSAQNICLCSCYCHLQYQLNKYCHFPVMFYYLVILFSVVLLSKILSSILTSCAVP
jgi:hypothetical protein